MLKEAKMNEEAKTLTLVLELQEATPSASGKTLVVCDDSWKCSNRCGNQREAGDRWRECVYSKEIDLLTKAVTFDDVSYFLLVAVHSQLPASSVLA